MVTCYSTYTYRYTHHSFILVILGHTMVRISSILIISCFLHVQAVESNTIKTPAIHRDKRSVYQGVLVKDLSGGSVDEILEFVSTETDMEISDMADDEKKATLIEAASNNSVHSNSDLQSWVYEEDRQSVTSRAIISHFLKSRGLKAEAELKQMSFLHQYDVMVLQVTNRYEGEEEVLRNMTVVHLVKRLEFYITDLLHLYYILFKYS